MCPPQWGHSFFPQSLRGSVLGNQSVLSSQYCHCLLSLELSICLAIFPCKALTPRQQDPCMLHILAAQFLLPLTPHTAGPQSLLQPGFFCREMRRLHRCIIIEGKASACPIYLNPLWCFSFSIFQLSSSVLPAIFRLLPSGHIQCICQPVYHCVSNQSTSDPSKMSWFLLPFMWIRRVIFYIKYQKRHNYNTLIKMRLWGNLFINKKKGKRKCLHTS